MINESTLIFTNPKTISSTSKTIRKEKNPLKYYETTFKHKSSLTNENIFHSFLQKPKDNRRERDHLHISKKGNKNSRLLKRRNNKMSTITYQIKPNYPKNNDNDIYNCDHIKDPSEYEKNSLINSTSFCSNEESEDKSIVNSTSDLKIEDNRILQCYQKLMNINEEIILLIELDKLYN